VLTGVAVEKESGGMVLGMSVLMLVIHMEVMSEACRARPGTT